jgi:hypothetical protein
LNVLKALVWVFLWMPVYFQAQRIVSFDLFQVYSNNSVAIKFTIGAGPSCNGYIIWHSADSVNYQAVENSPVICGGSGVNEDKSFTHGNPAINQVNYYKIELIPYETSFVKRIFVTEQGRTRMMPYPNPVYNDLSELKLRIYNVSNIRLEGFLYNQAGTQEQELLVETKEDLAIIDIGKLENGMYVVWLTDGTKPYSAKFIINRR